MVVQGFGSLSEPVPRREGRTAPSPSRIGHHCRFIADLRSSWSTGIGSRGAQRRGRAKCGESPGRRTKATATAIVEIADTGGDSRTRHRRIVARGKCNQMNPAPKSTSADSRWHGARVRWTSFCPSTWAANARARDGDASPGARNGTRSAPGPQDARHPAWSRCARHQTCLAAFRCASQPSELDRASRPSAFRVLHFSVQQDHLHAIVEAETRTSSRAAFRGSPSGSPSPSSG